jgi:hypothetical protein
MKGRGYVLEGCGMQKDRVVRHRMGQGLHIRDTY